MKGFKISKIFLLLFVFVVAGTGFASDAKTYQMRISSHLNAQDATGMACNKFAELVANYSGGRIKSSVFLGGELGEQRALVEMVHDGSLEITTTLPGASGYVPELVLFELPYIYEDDAHMVRVLKKLRPYVAKLLKKHNLIPLGYIDIGFRHMLNKKRPIYKVADLKGLKMRGPNPLYIGMFVSLGASATTVTWTEVYTALQTGVVDGIEASPALIYASKLHEQAKYLSKTYHIGANMYFMVGDRWFKSLPKNLQEIVVKAADEASDYGFKMEMELEKKAMDILVAEGVKINEVNNIKEFRKACIAFREKYVKEQGPAYVALYKEISKAL